MLEISKRQIQLHDKSENTYKLFESISFLNHSAYQSLFNGSIIRDCYIDTMDFSRCDFEGTIIEKTEIYNTNFFHTYFQTAIISGNVIFSNCSFDTGKINNSTFTNCHFENCSFTSAVLSKCNFINCDFECCDFLGANITLCRFAHCEFTDIKLGDCSFYQQMMIKNVYNNVSINIDSLGQIWGISLEDITNFQYIFLGEEYGYANTDLFEKIVQIYESKKWFTSKIIFEHNINKINNFDLIHELNKELIRKIESKEIIKQIELDFLINIINELYDTETLPLFSLYLSILELKESITKYKNVYYKEIIKMLENYITIIISLAKEMLYKIVDEASYLTEYDENQTVQFTIHYIGEENLEIYKIIQQASDMLIDSKVTLKEVRKGTIIEVLLTTAACIFIFQLCLYGINGCLIQITDMKSKLNVLKRKKLPQDYVKQSMLGKQQQPELLRVVLDKLNTQMVSALIKLFSKCNNLDIIDTSLEDVSQNN